MAIINPANLYGGGQGILRDDFVNFAANQKAKRRAIDEASNQYFTKIVEGINTAGVRDVDQPYINQRLAGLQSKWLSNKDLIKKGGLPQQDFLKEISSIRQDIDRSKGRGELLLTIGKAQFDGKFKPREKDLPILQKIGLPINDPNSKREDGVTEYGLGDLSASAKPWTSRDEMQLAKTAIGNFKPTYDPSTPEVDMGSSGQVIVTERFKPEEIKAIGESAARLIKGNNSAESYYEDLLENPDSVKRATEALQKVYGANLPDGSPLVANDATKMAQGLMLDKAFSTIVQRPVVNKEEERKFKEKLQGQRLDAAMRRLKVSESGKAARLNKMMEGLQVDDVVGTAKARGIDFNMPGKGNVKLVPLEKLDPIEVEDILGKPNKYGEYPIAPYKSPQGNQFIIINPNNQVETESGVIDQNRVLNNTFIRTKGFLKAKYKKEVKTPEAASSLNATQRKRN